MASGSASKSLKKHSDEARKKKPKSKYNSKSKSKSKSKSSKRLHDSSLSPCSSESDSDDYRRKKKKLKPKKTENKGKEHTKKTHKKKRRRRHSPSSSSCDTYHNDESRSPTRRQKSKKRYRNRSLSRSPIRSCSTCSVSSGDHGRRRSIRGRSPRRPESHVGTKIRSGSRDTSDKAFDDRCEETKLATEVVSVKDDLVMEKSVGIDVGDDTGKNAYDLELILRQKALENFMKFRGGLSANKESVDDMKNEAVTLIVEEERWNPNSTGTLDQLNSGAVSIGEKKSQVIRTSSYQDKQRDASVETSKPTGKPMASSSIGGSSMPRPNQLKNVQGSLRTTLAKVAQERKLVPKPGHDNVHSGAVSIGDRRDKAVSLNSYNDNRSGVPTEEIIWNRNCNDTSKRVGKPMVSSSSGGGSIPMPDQLKNVLQGSSNGMFLDQSTLTEVAQDKKLVDKAGADKGRVGAASIGDRKDVATRNNVNDKQRTLTTEERNLNPNSTETSKPAGSTLEGRSMALPNHLKGVQVSSNKMSSEQITLAGESGGEKTNTGAVSVGDESAPMASVPVKDNENCEANESVVGSASGSQFEKKTFCRVHDGETVQVKYTVYIPKKTPALARRKLQG